MVAHAVGAGSSAIGRLTTALAEHVRDDAHKNTIESNFPCPQRLKRYLVEFDFRYSETIALGVFDEARTTKALRSSVDQRLTSKDSPPASISDLDS